MSDDNSQEPDPVDWAEKRKEWESRLASGQPLQHVLVDLPMKVIREGAEGPAAGGLAIDTATFGLMGFDRLGVVRLHLTPAAVSTLKVAFAELEKNPDMPSVEIRKSSAN
jgi:hypothetical protein